MYRWFLNKLTLRSSKSNSADNFRSKKTYIITILDILYSSAFHLEQEVSDTGFSLRLSVKPTQLFPIELVCFRKRGNE
jgi:hypothetical protein